MQLPIRGPWRRDGADLHDAGDTVVSYICFQHGCNVFSTKKCSLEILSRSQKNVLVKSYGITQNTYSPGMNCPNRTAKDVFFEGGDVRFITFYFEPIFDENRGIIRENIEINHFGDLVI